MRGAPASWEDPARRRRRFSTPCSRSWGATAGRARAICDQAADRLRMSDAIPGSARHQRSSSARKDGPSTPAGSGPSTARTRVSLVARSGWERGWQVLARAFAITQKLAHGSGSSARSCEQARECHGASTFSASTTASGARRHLLAIRITQMPSRRCRSITDASRSRSARRQHPPARAPRSCTLGTKSLLQRRWCRRAHPEDGSTGWTCGYQPTSSSARDQMGSCNHRTGHIRLNTGWLKPKDLLRYVVVHEILRLVRPNHSGDLSNC